MKMVIYKRSLATVGLAAVMVSLLSAVPAQASQAADCAVSASFTGYCVVQPGATVTGVLKAGNGGPGGNGGRGGNLYGGGFLGGAGGNGGVGGAGAKIPFSYTNTTSAAVTLQFAVGTNGAYGAAGPDGIDGVFQFAPVGTNGTNGQMATDGSPTAVKDTNDAALFTAEAGTAGFGGTGGLAASESANGTAGSDGTSGTPGFGSTMDTTWFEAPFASITFAGIPGGAPEPAAPNIVPAAHTDGFDHAARAASRPSALHLAI